MNNINSSFELQGIGSIGSLGSEEPKVNKNSGFKNMLTNHLKNTNNLLQSSQQAQDDFMTGKNTNIHSAMIAMERASVAMQFTIQMRNRLVEGFQEIMRMQV